MHVPVDMKVASGQEPRHSDWYRTYEVLHSVHSEELIHCLQFAGQVGHEEQP